MMVVVEEDAFKGASLGRPNPTANVPIPSTSFASVVAEKDKPVRPAPPKPKAKATFVNLTPSFESHVVIRSANPKANPREILREIRKIHPSLASTKDVVTSINTSGKVVFYTKTTQMAKLLSSGMTSLPTGLSCHERPVILPRYRLFRVDGEGSHRSNIAAHSTNTVFIEVDNQVAEILGQHGRIPVAGLMHRYERSHTLKQCFRCCGFGHRASACPAAHPIYYRCGSAEHEGTQCSVEPSQTKNSEATIKPFTTSSTCPFEKERIARTRNNSIIAVYSAYWHGFRAADYFIPLLKDTIRRASLPVILGMDTNAHSPTWGIGARLNFLGANLEDFARFNDLHFLGPPVVSTWVVNGIGKKREAESNGQKFQVDRPRPVRTPATVSKVKRLATTENPPSQRQLSRMCGTSLKTINNIIHKDLELDTRRKGKVHKLTPFHMKNRATNARKLYEEHLAGSRSEYTATLDEAWMYVTYCNGIRKICYIKRGNQVPDNWVHQCSETFPKGFMVVGVMTGRGVLPLIKVPSKVKVNSEFYIECVLKPVIEQLKDLYPGEMDKVFLHHDKASSHTSNKTQQFLQEMKDTLGLNFIRNSDIPVKSPDASPLDFYGFGMLKQRLFNRRPKTEAGLWKAAQEEWSNVSLSKVKEVFAAWKVRCREIAKKKGKHIEHMKKIHVTTQLNEASTPEDIDRVVLLLTSILQSACDSCMRRGSNTTRPSKPWWTPELSLLRRRLYGKLKSKSWFNLCKEVSSASWSAIHRFIARGRGSPRGPPLLKHDNGSPYYPHETCQAVLNHFFLPDTRPHPLRNAISAHSDEPEFKPWEVLRAIHRCVKRKAPGPDDRFKMPRPGRPFHAIPASRIVLQMPPYGPIPPSMEKRPPHTSAKTLQFSHQSTDRHGWFFEDQYGFVNGRSAEDALASITQFIEERQAHWRKTLVISLDIRLRILGQPLKIKKTITILGVKFDQARGFAAHLRKITRRCRSIISRLTHSIQGKFEISFSAGTRIFDAVVVPAFLYGASAWGRRALSSEGIRQLRSLHYNFAKRVLRGGPCTPTVSAISITGSPPLDIIVGSRTAFLKEINEGNFESRSGPASLPYPPDRRQLSFGLNIKEITTPIIFTDGSKNEAGVGAAIILSSEDQHPVLLRFHQDCTAFQAELLAIRWAVRLVEEGYSRNEITITSDYRSALSAICTLGPVRSTLVAEIILALNTNQNLNLCWVPGHCGFEENEKADRAAKNAAVSFLEPSFSILPRSLARNYSHAAALDAWTEVYCRDHCNRHLRRIAHTPDRLLQFLPKVCPGEVSTTLFTTHCHVRADLVLWHPGEDPSCPHCMEEQQTVDPLLFRCPAFMRHRMHTALLPGKTSFDPVLFTGLPATRIKRWSLKLTAFNYTVEFRKTSDNSNADALSRLPLESGVRESIDEDQSMPRIGKHAPATISEWTWPEKPWHRLHIDLAGPFMERMFLVLVDAYSKWIEIFILRDITRKTIISHLREIFAKFGMPEYLVTDNGRQFVSREFEQFTKMNGIRHTKSVRIILVQMV
ncbi:K02A2.6-like [Cordylochernes scorpioides]|uniref:K02A2.6-like n=1 Tax=Cordylochernes scorpioides TaxID=51811 RepID=A0ABY6KSW1_9ARAC|nr:K02A2.6-like [Cordylochernes scorpioides]